MAINREKIISDLSKLEVKGNADGIIDAFGVFVNQMPADCWNGFAMRIMRGVPAEMKETAHFLLYNAANECGYHTGYGIITSKEWEAVVAPMLEKIPEDVLHGAFAVFTAWGWANAEIVELVPNEKMVVRAYDYYESDVAPDKKSPFMTAFMIEGVSAAFMDLAYGKPYPNGHRTFTCKQTKGIEKGDAYGEFVVTPTEGK